LLQVRISRDKIESRLSPSDYNQIYSLG
jgi:hypothetical protein